MYRHAHCKPEKKVWASSQSRERSSTFPRLLLSPRTLSYSRDRTSFRGHLCCSRALLLLSRTLNCPDIPPLLRTLSCSRDRSSFEDTQLFPSPFLFPRHLCPENSYTPSRLEVLSFSETFSPSKIATITALLDLRLQIATATTLLDSHLQLHSLSSPRS